MSIRYRLVVIQLFLQNAINLLGAGIYENGKFLNGQNAKKRKHDATSYLNELRNKYSNLNLKIVFVLDATYDKNVFPNRFEYLGVNSERYQRISPIDFPATYHFLATLSYIKDVYDFYILWHPADDYSDENMCLYYVKFDSSCKDNDVFKGMNCNFPRLWLDFRTIDYFKTVSVSMQ